MEVREEVVGVRRHQVRRAPKRHALPQLDRFEAISAEEGHVVAPLALEIRALCAKPVVVAWSEKGAKARASKSAAQELERVRGDAVLLEEVSRAEQRVDGLGLSDRDDVLKGPVAGGA